MELTLKRLLEQAEFTQVKKGGYDRDEVNDFLDRAVAMATKVEAKLTQTMEQARSATDGSGRSAEEIEIEINERVEARVAEHIASLPPPAPAQPAQPAAVAAPSSADAERAAEEQLRTLVLAQRTADAAIREAREDAARIMSEVSAEAVQSRTDLAQELEAERDEAKGRIRAEITELESAREGLRTDVGILERHVEEQRNQLRSSLGELQRLLEDPSGFRLAPTPTLIEAQVPDNDDTPLIETPDEAPAADAALSAPAPSAPAAEPAVVIEPAAGPELTFGDVEHAPPPSAPSASVGEPTQPVSAVTGGSDDRFMAELRKAMNDDQPLGPRDDTLGGALPSMDDDSNRGWRFGRR